MIIAPLKGFAGLNTLSSLPLCDGQLIKNKVDKEQKRQMTPFYSY